MTFPFLLSALALGLALAADAFAAALCQGAIARPRATHATALTIGAVFGAAQGVAPLLGWSLGLAFAGAIEAIDHWVAFTILAVLGGKLIHEGLSEQDADAAPKRARGWALVALAVATSIDAAAAGLAFDAMALPPFAAAGVIAAVTFIVAAGGVYLGRAFGAALGGKAEVLGGVALMLIGLKILADHHAFG